MVIAAGGIEMGKLIVALVLAGVTFFVGYNSREAYLERDNGMAHKAIGGSLGVALFVFLMAFGLMGGFN